jgi:hypothetical protein
MTIIVKTYSHFENSDFSSFCRAKTAYKKINSKYKTRKLPAKRGFAPKEPNKLNPENTNSHKKLKAQNSK